MGRGTDRVPLARDLGKLRRSLSKGSYDGGPCGRPDLEARPRQRPVRRDTHAEYRAQCQMIIDAIRYLDVQESIRGRVEVATWRPESHMPCSGIGDAIGA